MNETQRATTYTGFSGADMYVPINNVTDLSEENIAYEIQAITWLNEKAANGKIPGSIVIVKRNKDMAGPADVMVAAQCEDGMVKYSLVEDVELIDRETGETVDWKNAEMATAYHFVANGVSKWSEFKI